MIMEPSHCRLGENEVSVAADMELAAKYLNLVDTDTCTDIFKDQTIAGLPIVGNDIACDSTSSNTVSAETKTYADDFSLDLSMDHIDIASTVLPRAAEAVGIADNQDPVYPDLIFVGDGTASDNPIDLNNIQLYLECSDDSENLVATSPFESGCEILSQTGTSLLKSDVRLKISFPVFPEESEKGFKCSLCKNHFILEGDLRSHILQEHQQEICMCPFCCYNTKSKKFFKTHIKTKHKQLLETSELSNEHVLMTYSNVQTINSSAAARKDREPDTSPPSMHSHNGLGSAVELQNCNVVTSLLPVSLEAHQLQTDNATLEEMQSRSTPAVNLVSHIVDVQETEQVGGKDFLDNETVLDNNGNAEHSDRISEQFACQDCSFITKSSKLLNMHFSTMHDSNRTVYRCTKCSYTCKQRRSLLSHMDLHMGAYKFECEVCLKKFVSKPMLTRHKKNHSEDRKHTCDVEDCRAAFKTKGALTDHQKKVHNVMVRRSVAQDADPAFRDKNDKSTCTSTDRLVTRKLNATNNNSSMNAKCPSKCDTHSVKNGHANTSKVECNTVVSAAYLCSTYDSLALNPRSSCTKTSMETANFQSNRGDVKLKTCNVNSPSNSLYSATTYHETELETKQTSNNFGHTASKVNPKIDIFRRKATCTGKTSQTKSFKCSYPNCNKAFRDNFNLRNHMCTHEGLKNLSCCHCDFVCVQKSSLNYHYKSKHTELMNKK